MRKRPKKGFSSLINHQLVLLAHVKCGRDDEKQHGTLCSEGNGQPPKPLPNFHVFSRCVVVSQVGSCEIVDKL
jgi:hypothetical protein